MFRFWPSRNKSVKVIGDHVEIGGRSFLRIDNLDCGDGLGTVSVEHIAQVVEHYAHLTHGEYNPQLAGLIYAVTNNP